MGANSQLLKFSQYTWIGLTIFAAVIAVATGMSIGFAALCVVFGIIPAIAGIWVISSDDHNPMGEAIIVLGWTLLAALAVALSGGARSAAIILFAVGPVTAYMLGSIRLTIESAIFSAVSYLGMAALGSFGLLPDVSSEMSTMGGAAAALGIAQILMLIWAELPKKEAPTIQPSAPLHLSAINTEADIKANKMMKERNAYFASLSHDLRSPFTAILGYAEAFKMNLKGNLTERQVDQASIIHESAQDLLSLVDDMMDLAKSEAGKLTLDLEPVHLGDLGRSIMQQMQAMADRKNITLEIEAFGEPWAMADARLVRRIWQNLISNAIKYSEDGSIVQLSASERSNQAVLTVTDNGRGMSEEDLESIAQPFAMGHNSAGKSGTGLGLVNVKRFADMHGGRVVIDTAPGEGARFQVILPKADVTDLGPI